MIRTILSIAIFSALTTASLQADPKNSKKSNSQKTQQTSTSQAVSTTPLVSGWSYTNGTWTHVDGYKLVNGKVVRSGIQTHKKVPNPPTKAEMDAVVKKQKPAGPKTPAEIAAEKAAERNRNLAPRPAPQTGSHL